MSQLKAFNWLNLHCISHLANLYPSATVGTVHSVYLYPAGLKQLRIVRCYSDCSSNRTREQDDGGYQFQRLQMSSGSSTSSVQLISFGGRRLNNACAGKGPTVVSDTAAVINQQLNFICTSSKLARRALYTPGYTSLGSSRRTNYQAYQRHAALSVFSNGLGSLPRNYSTRDWSLVRRGTSPNLVRHSKRCNLSLSLTLSLFGRVPLRTSELSHCICVLLFGP